MGCCSSTGVKTDENDTRADECPGKTKGKKSSLYQIVRGNLKEGTKDSIVLQVEAETKERIYPIWINEGTCIKFRVFGKWQIDAQYPPTDANGMPSNLVQIFNNGALVARIGSGDYFSIKDESVRIATTSGPLYLKMFLPKAIKLQPKGELVLVVYGGNSMSLKEINKKQGWLDVNQEKGMDDLGKLEAELACNINNMRGNPFLFFEKNIGNYRDMIITKDFIQEVNKTGVKTPFIINNYLHDEMTTLVNDLKIQKVDKNYSIKGIVSYAEYLSKQISVKMMIELELEDTDYKIMYKSMRQLDTMRMALEYLYDTDLRTYFFTKIFSSIAVKIAPKFFNDLNLVVVVLFNDVKGKAKKKNKK